jgi:hypothetical protein
MRYVTTSRHTVHVMTDPGDPRGKMCVSNVAMPTDPQRFTEVPQMAIDMINSSERTGNTRQAALDLDRRRTANLILNEGWSPLGEIACIQT